MKTRKVFNVSLFRKNGECVDTTQIDEKDEKFAKELFYDEFHHVQLAGDYLEWEEDEEEVEEDEPTISIEDVLQVAKDLNFKPTSEQVKEIIDLYPTAQLEDNTANWDMVVEQLLYDVEAEQVEPKYKYVFINIEIQDGESSYNCKSVHSLNGDIDTTEFAEEYAQTYFGSEENAEERYEGNGWYWDNQMTKMARLYNHNDLTKEEYDIMSKYL